MTAKAKAKVTKAKAKAKAPTKKRATSKRASKTTSSSVARKAARILATSTDADERAVAASALSQVEHAVGDTSQLIVSAHVDPGPAYTSTPFSLNDFIADVLANVGTGSSIGYECYTAENLVEALSWLNYNGGYVYGSDGTCVEVRKRAQQ